MATSRKQEIRDQDVQGLKCLRKIRPLLSRLRKVGTERDRAGNRRLFMDQSCALILLALFSPAIEADRCCVLDRGYVSERLWNAIDAAGSSYVCRASDRTAATVTHVNEPTEADRAASVISDEVVDLGWKSRHRTLPDHPMRLMRVAVKPHGGCRGMRGPTCELSPEPRETPIHKTAREAGRRPAGPHAGGGHHIGNRRAEQDCGEAGCRSRLAAFVVVPTIRSFRPCAIRTGRRRFPRDGSLTCVATAPPDAARPLA
jgi:hypothetical protein